MDNQLHPGHVWIDVVSGREGSSLSIGNDESGYRLAGPKPWGGGRTINRFMVNIDELTREVAALAIAAAKHDQIACSLVNGRGSNCTCDASAPKAALTDEQIKQVSDRYTDMRGLDVVKFARALLAASKGE